jgi:GNAT superfamily N-acetyltransferase
MRLVQASEPQKVARDVLTAQTWAGPLSTERFLERERALRTHPWAQRMTTWLWCAENGDVLSSCETFVSEAHGGLAATIASVFTEPKLRGRGHAEAMLRELINVYRVRGDVLALTLFSEIGPKLYERVGFQPVPSFDVLLEPLATAPDVEWNNQLPSENGNDGELRLIVSRDRFDWQLVREDFYGHRLDFHGAIDGDASITWTAYWKEKELQVLTYDRVTPKLLDAARHAAFRAGLPFVRIWETEPLTVGQRVSRDDELPMFLPLSQSIRAWAHIHRALWA